MPCNYPEDEAVKQPFGPFLQGLVAKANAVAFQPIEHKIST